MKEFIPLFQTSLWVLAIFVLVIYFKKEIGLIRDILKQRLESGSTIKIGPIEIGKLEEQVKHVSIELYQLNEKVSSLFLTTMSPYMYLNLVKIASNNFGEYKITKGLKRELYHLRDIGYIEIESISAIPKNGNNLSEFVKISPTGESFVELREKLESESNLKV